MAIKRLKDLSKTLYARYRARQLAGTMIEYIDEQGYICYDEEEAANYVPKKNGRKIKKSEV